MLKAAIFSLHHVLTEVGPLDDALLAETFKLLRYLKSRSIALAFISNHNWTITENATGRTRNFKDVLEDQLGAIGYYVGGQAGMPYKPLAAATTYILQKHGWSNREVVFVGNSENDMKTASNGKLMFLNATWRGDASPYGFRFASPMDIARFIDCLCLGLNDWFWSLNNGPLRVYAMAPFSTLSSQYLQAHAYSANAKATAKNYGGDPTFWGRLLTARIYFSGLVDEIDYLTAYPGHSPASPQTVIAEALNILGGSLRKTYLPDLIKRHSAAKKSQTARTSGQTVDVVNQLTTIHLNPFPQRGLNGAPFKSTPLKAGKTVLVVDDFCTEGNSFEAARAFIESTGASAICLSWLKTINVNYQAVSPPLKIPSPYKPVSAGTTPLTVQFGYHGAITAHAAQVDLAKLYARYFMWAWPEGI